jgi:hypothetical protein
MDFTITDLHEMEKDLRSSKDQTLQASKLHRSPESLSADEGEQRYIVKLCRKHFKTANWEY